MISIVTYKKMGYFIGYPIIIKRIIFTFISNSNLSLSFEHSSNTLINSSCFCKAAFAEVSCLSVLNVPIPILSPRLLFLSF